MSYHVKFTASGSHGCYCLRNTLNILLLDPNKILLKIVITCLFRRVIINGENRKFAFSYLSVCLSTYISVAPTGRIFVKFYAGDFYKELFYAFP